MKSIDRLGRNYRGVEFGRPKITIPSSFPEVSNNYKNKKITSCEACHLLGLS